MRDRINKLFVYGTLMHSFSNDYAKLIQAEAEFLGNACIPGILFDLGSYPGAIYDQNQTQQIHGEVYEFEGNKFLLELDFYEGNWEKLKSPKEFIRIEIPIFLHQEWVRSWFYQYNLSLNNLSMIESGDYQTYLKGLLKR